LGEAVGYVDRVVVPEVRREAGSAARLMAAHLERLADRLNPRMQPYRKQDQ
jgi:predicted GNAT superfamily acetyltransferase